MGPKQKGAKLNRWSVLAIIVAVVGLPLLLAVLLRILLFEARYIVSGSMEPTLAVNDRVLVDKFAYRLSPPQRGDVILFDPTPALQQTGFDNAFVNRIVAVPGDRVELSQGQVLLNGDPLAEPYLAAANSTFVEPCSMAGFPNALLTQPQSIPAGHYLTLGDNRENSFDGRCWGLVPRAKVIGRVSRIYWPPDRAGQI